MTKEQAFTLWRTGEIPAPPKEHEEYCWRRAKLKVVENDK